MRASVVIFTVPMVVALSLQSGLTRAQSEPSLSGAASAQADAAAPAKPKTKPKKAKKSQAKAKTTTAATADPAANSAAPVESTKPKTKKSNTKKSKSSATAKKSKAGQKNAAEAAATSSAALGASAAGDAQAGSATDAAIGSAEPSASAELATPLPEPAPEPPPPPPPIADEPAAPPPKPRERAQAPYSLPFQLRSVVASTAVRSDSALAGYEGDGNNDPGTVFVSTLLLSYKVIDGLAPLVRLGLVDNSPPSTLSDSNLSFVNATVGFLNPLVGAVYGLPIGSDFKLGFFLGFTIPVGSGAGNDPDVENVRANAAGIQARSALDNALFATQFFTVTPGVGFAYVAHGFTAQVEATVLQLTRVKGDNVEPDSSRTNFTSGAHVGYFFIPYLSGGLEFRYQRWLSTPAMVENDPTGASRDTSTFAFGVRGHIPLGEKRWVRPALVAVAPIDDPLRARNYRILQLDLPFVF